MNEQDPPLIRKRLGTIEHFRDAKSGHPKGQTTYGFTSQIRLEKGERMCDKMAACFAGVKAKLKEQVPNILFNAPEIFPVNGKECIVLITGWRSEIILVS